VTHRRPFQPPTFCDSVISHIHTSYEQRDMDPDPSSGSPWVPRQLCHPRGWWAASRHRGEAFDVSALGQQRLVIFIQSLLLSSRSIYTDSSGLKVTGCEINWAVNSFFQQMNYPVSLFRDPVVSGQKCHLNIWGEIQMGAL